MSIYWCDREGNFPPPNCKFHIHPFFSAIDLPQKIERVEHLPTPASFKAIKHAFSPDQDQWMENVEKAIEMIRKKEIHKVVLARCLTLEFETALDPLAITASLKSRAQGAYLFCIQTPLFSFLGASPERLFARKGRIVESEAVAGTRKRGKSPFEDDQLKLQLLSSKKDLREFSYVQTYLQETLHPFCESSPSFTPLTVHSTQNVQHIYSKCRAHLKEGISDSHLLSALHPTPALCGLPKKKSFQLIHKLEPFERGLYGGAIGWSTPDSSDWLVGIRSCLIQGNTVKLYTGAGIVEGSDPMEEWEEMNQKLRLYAGILDH